MLFYQKNSECGQGLLEWVVILLLLGIAFYSVMSIVAPDKLQEIMSKF